MSSVAAHRPREWDRAAFIENVEWLAQTGERFDRAARRLNLTPDNLEKRLRRLRRPDLVEALGGYDHLRP